jgi:hypothetical protein
VAEYGVVLRVRQIISELTLKPASFDSVMARSLTDLFHTLTVHQESILAAVVEEIFVQVMDVLMI